MTDSVNQCCGRPRPRPRLSAFRIPDSAFRFPSSVIRHPSNPAGNPPESANWAGMKREILAFDLGAESGRAVLGGLGDGKLELEEVHRFPNEPQWILGRLHWDTPRLFAEIKNGRARAVRQKDARPASIGVDTWGVDFA